MATKEFMPHHFTNQTNNRHGSDAMLMFLLETPGHPTTVKLLAQGDIFAMRETHDFVRIDSNTLPVFKLKGPK